MARTFELIDQHRHIIDRAAALQAVRNGLLNRGHRGDGGAHRRDGRPDGRKQVRVGASDQSKGKEEAGHGVSATRAPKAESPAAAASFDGDAINRVRRCCGGVDDAMKTNIRKQSFDVFPCVAHSDKPRSSPGPVRA